MAKDKTGIKYFSQDSDHVMNSKVKLLFNEFDSHGVWIWECLKCEIYAKKGYYFDLNDADELTLFASDVCKKPVSLVKEVITGCVRRGLFDKSVFEMFNVLTSDRIQSNYLDSTREKRKKGFAVTSLILEFLLIKIGENEKRIDLISVKNKEYRESIENSREKTNNNREKVRKVNESKVNESKVNESKVNESKVNEIREGTHARSSPPSDIFIFFKKESGWDDKKCEAVARKFEIEYNSKFSNPRFDWQAKARKWIVTEFDSEKFNATGTGFPNYFDKQFESKLDNEALKKYWAHLRLLGWTTKPDHQGNTKWIKSG